MTPASPTLLERLAGLGVERRYRRIYKPGLFLASLTPLGWIAGHVFGWFGLIPAVDTVKFLELEFGQTALNFLLLTLVVTPLRQLAGLTHLLRLRRMLGLFAFFYAALHFTVYLALDLDLDWHMVGADIAKRPYITIGLAAFVLLIALAATSTQGMMRRLGPRWRKLHRLVYVAAILGVWHYYWQEKIDVREPLLYGSALTVLLGYRLMHVVRKRAPRAQIRTTGPHGQQPRELQG